MFMDFLDKKMQRVSIKLFFPRKPLLERLPVAGCGGEDLEYRDPVRGRKHCFLTHNHFLSHLEYRDPVRGRKLIVIERVFYSVII